MRRSFVLTCALLALVPAAASAATVPVTPAGWRVQPAGEEFGIGKLETGFNGPLGSALSPDGRHLLTSSSGAARIDTLDAWNLAQAKRTGYVPYDAKQGGALFYGVVYSPDGKKAWASGGGQNVVHVYDVSGDSVTQRPSDIPVPRFPAGIAYGSTPAHGDRV
jgi:hypothetical protein